MKWESMQQSVYSFTCISDVDMVWLPSASNMSNTSRAFFRRDLASRSSACLLKIRAHILYTAYDGDIDQRDEDSGMNIEDNMLSRKK